jgi:CRP-like cAMP-binding protein
MADTILLIEDNLEMAENISSILKLAHYNVVSANNGKNGITAAQERRPDLILCDIMMPDLDGYSVFHILNNDPVTKSIPFIFLTAKSDKADIRYGMNLGADDYMTKPFDGHDLLKLVDVRLKKNAFLRASFNNDLQDVNKFFRKARELREFTRLSDNRPVRVYRKKEFLFMEGEIANELFFVVKGEVKTFKTNPEGKELITGIFRTGDFVGYSPLLEDSVHNECAMVLEDTEIALIPKQDFVSLIYSSKDIARKFIQLLSNNVAETEKRLLNLAYQSVRQRVAWALLDIQKLAINEGETMIHICRRDISNIIGTATESLNRTLSDFKDEGLVDITPEGLRVADKAGLERVAQISG